MQNQFNNLVPENNRKINDNLQIIELVNKRKKEKDLLGGGHLYKFRTK